MPVNWNVQLVRVSANDINFEVATMGSGDRLALCLHGFPEHAYSWRNQMPLLAHLGYRVWAPNLRGYGATDCPREASAYSPRILIEDVASLIRAANAKETLVVAHDLGAVLAWLLAMEQPQLIARLIILNLPASRVLCPRSPHTTSVFQVLVHAFLPAPVAAGKDSWPAGRAWRF